MKLKRLYNITMVCRLLAKFVALLLLTGCQSTNPASIYVDTKVEHQNIVAWGAVSRLWEFDKSANKFNGSWLKNRDAILEKLIVEGGITQLRLEIRSGAENPIDYWPAFHAGKLSYEEFKDHFYEKINDNDDPLHVNQTGFQFSELDYRIENLVLPAMMIAKRHGIRLALNLNYVDFRWTRKQGTLSHANNPDEYAELIATAFAHMKEKYGLVPDELEVILEPDNTADWRGPQIGRAMVATAKRFRSDRVVLPSMIAPSTARASLALRYLDGIATVPGALPLVQTISYHRYDQQLSENTIRKIGERGRSLGKQTAMLEHVEGTADELIEDLTEGNVSSWLLWAIAWNGAKDGYPVIVDEKVVGSPQVRLSTVGRQLALVFRSVRPGDQRIGANASNPNLRSAAFRRANGTLALVVSASHNVGQGLFGRILKKLGPKRHFRLTITGMGNRQYLVRSVDAEGREGSCIAGANDLIGISTGTVMIVIPLPVGTMAPACNEG
ncbi:hypothetical protein GRI89_14465 [Altererythrobacter salegens]|uniref:Uncharacterized protein n=1 Tax=Croceibacterium salegens TaxID=1737568 RepID=A0A6I4SY33_9SPHN|nr:hypothetical protein [Croceibacterium salegens]MXO60743.1 hypothetical protein [Croceibacterium salegens]